MKKEPYDTYEEEETEEFEDSDEISESDESSEKSESERRNLPAKPRKSKKYYYEPQKSKTSLNLILVVIAIVAIAIAVCVVCITLAIGKDETPVEPASSSEEVKETVITVSTLEKILETEELSTYEVKYSGVATRSDEKKPEKVDYYVSYEATVKAGIDFNEIQIMLDSESKRIVATLPDVKITNINVEETSLEYLFYDKKADKVGITSEAYALCKDDVAKKVEGNENILEIATQNAKSAVEALLYPFIKDMDEEYTLEVKTQL